MTSGTQKEIKISSVYFWESGDMSRLNDDAMSSVNTTSLSNATLPNARAEGMYRVGVV